MIYKIAEYYFNQNHNDILRYLESGDFQIKVFSETFESIELDRKCFSYKNINDDPYHCEFFWDDKESNINITKFKEFRIYKINTNTGMIVQKTITFDDTFIKIALRNKKLLNVR